MTSSSVSWSARAVQELARRAAPSSLTPSSTALNAASIFLVRPDAHGTSLAFHDPQALLLIQRPGRGITGIELHGQSHPFIATDALCGSRRKRLLQAYMMRKGFRQQPSAEEAAIRRFLLLHTNHLVANALGAQNAMPIYAHSLAELARLGAHTFATLDPAQCLVTRQFVEWENWREVVAEPGWELHIGAEHLPQALVSGALRPSEIPKVTERASLQPAKTLCALE